MNQNINDDIIINMYITDKKRVNSNLVRNINNVKYKAYKEYLDNRYNDIDLNRFVGIKHELNFFKDTSMKSNQTIFTYNNIHKDALHLLNNKFLEKLKEKLIVNIKF